MSKLGIAITAIVCLPLGALLQRPASAQVRLNGLDQPSSETHFGRAQSALREARTELQASERANETMWGNDSSHATRARDAVEKAQLAADEVANWIALDPDHAAGRPPFYPFISAPAILISLPAH